MAKTGPGTCGVKYTGGLCSDWCDSLRPVEEEDLPDTQPGLWPSVDVGQYIAKCPLGDACNLGPMCPWNVP